MEILTVNGTALPAPNSYRVQLSDLDSEDTARTEDGLLVRQRVRAGVAKLSVSWAALSTEQCAQVLTATAAGLGEAREAAAEEPAYRFRRHRRRQVRGALFFRYDAHRADVRR